MKYLKYLGALLWTPIRKIWGLIWFPIIAWNPKLRAWSRNYHYNYVLQNGLYLARLAERKPEWDEDSEAWIIAPYHGTKGGYIKYRKVNYLVAKLNYWFIWGWLDDDSNYDTTDLVFIDSILNNERFQWLPEKVKRSLRRFRERELVYGNTFDIGDKRGDFPIYHFFASNLWNIRNTSYNFKYSQWANNKQHFYFRLGSYEFGWKRDKYSPIEKYELVFGRW